MRDSNRVTLVVPDTDIPSHFQLCEFANTEGIAIVHPTLVRSLEGVRGDLCEMEGQEVWLIITSGTRTDADNRRLANRLGWTDEGGLVSRRSKHLVKYGGIAADLKAFHAARGPTGYRYRIPQEVVGLVCQSHFDFVKADYRDGHVHADNRERVQ